MALRWVVEKFVRALKRMLSEARRGRASASYWSLLEHDAIGLNRRRHGEERLPAPDLGDGARSSSRTIRSHVVRRGLGKRIEFLSFLGRFPNVGEAAGEAVFEAPSVRNCFRLTWGVSGQAHSFAPAAGVSPAKRGEAQRSRERSDLDAPAAGYTVTSERALARSWLPLWSLPRSFILALRISFGVWIRSVSPSFACSLDGRITSHPVELVGARTIIPHARGRRARVGGDHPVKRRVSARQSRGHRPPGSGEAVAFGFAGMGLSR